MALAREGYDCLGIDFNPEMCRIVSEVHLIPARMASVSDLAQEGPQYDLIVFSHVLEHMEDPLQTLRDLKCILTPRGVLFVCLPNRRFIRQRRALVTGKLPDGNYPPHHVSFWSTKSLSWAMRKAGFAVVECYPQSYPEPLQAKHSLMHSHGVSSDAIAEIITRSATAIGKCLRLQGANLFAVGAIKET